MKFLKNITKHMQHIPTETFWRPLWEMSCRILSWILFEARNHVSDSFSVLLFRHEVSEVLIYRHLAAISSEVISVKSNVHQLPFCLLNEKLKTTSTIDLLFWVTNPNVCWKCTIISIDWQVTCLLYVGLTADTPVLKGPRIILRTENPSYATAYSKKKKMLSVTRR